MKHIISLLSVFWALNAFTQTLTFTTFSTGYNEPVAIAHAGDRRLFVVERQGTISICDSNGVRLPTPFLNITSIVGSGAQEQGLLGLAFHPQYAQNGYFYVNYIDLSGNTRIARFTRNAGNPNLADASSEFTIMTVAQPAPNHNGGPVKFGPDGYLYIALGDGGVGANGSNNAQNPLSLLGKILRIDVDAASPYAIPQDNPYVGNPAYAPEIWVMGVRNPWKFTFDRLTGDKWIADVGDGIEELNFEPSDNAGGRNYGWPCHEGFNTNYATGGFCTSLSSATLPVYEYDHISTTPGACSIIGGYVYRGARFGSLFGKYIFGDWCSGEVWLTEPNGNSWNTVSQGQILGTYLVWSFGEDVNGELYAVMGNWQGQIQHITISNSCTPAAFIFGNDTIQGPAQLVAGFYPGLNYQWLMNGNPIPGAVNSSYNASLGGMYSVIVTNPNGNCSDTSSLVFLDVSSGLADVNPTVEQFSIYPNPAQNTLTISSNSALNYTYEICDVSGRIVHTAEASGRTTVDVTSLQSGQYFIRFNCQSSRHIMRWIKL